MRRRRDGVTEIITPTCCSKLASLYPWLEKIQRPPPKLGGLIPSSTTSILLASTTPMLPIWSLTDGRPLLADCQRSNTSKALNKPSPQRSEIEIYFWWLYLIFWVEETITRAPSRSDTNHGARRFGEQLNRTTNGADTSTRSEHC